MIFVGNLLLWLIAFACLAAIISFGMAAFKRNEFEKIAHFIYKLFALLVLVFFIFFLSQILNHNFNLKYVFSYSSIDLDFLLLFSTLWAGQTGTFVLWLFFATIIGLILLRVKCEHKNRLIFFYLLTALFLVILILPPLKSSPFAPLDTEAMGIAAENLPLQDGRGLNPLLQNFWMIIHPPVVFLGYVLIAVPFAFAMTALSANRFSDWAGKAFPWSLLSLGVLGLGIFLGGYWAYETLGWGGYWAWDPVENSSLIPWLTNLALVHGLAVERKQGGFKNTNLALALISFILVIYGTFLTRSGILQEFSVHSFTEPGKVLYWIMIVFMAIFLFLSAILYALRLSSSKNTPKPMMNQEWYDLLMMLGVVFTILMAVLTWVGTSWPVITTIIGKPSDVNQSFYNSVALPIGIIMAVLTAIAALYLYITRGKGYFAGRIIVAAVLAGLGTIFSVSLGAHVSKYTILIYASLFAIFANILALIALPKKRFADMGGNLGHIGFGIMLIGFIASTVFSQSSGVAKLKSNEELQLLGMNCRFLGIGENFFNKDNRVEIEVKSGSSRYIARPVFYQDPYSNQTVINPYIHRSLFEDTYFAPQRYLPDYTTLTLVKGDSNTAFGYGIKFNEFKMEDHDQGGAMRVGAVLDITVENEVYAVIPYFSTSSRSGEEIYVRIPNTDYKVYLDRVIADEGMIIIDVVGIGDLVLEVSHKPLINLVWLGSVIIVLGSFLAFFKRKRMAAGGNKNYFENQTPFA